MDGAYVAVVMYWGPTTHNPATTLAETARQVIQANC